MDAQVWIAVYKICKRKIRKRGIDKKVTNSLEAVENFWNENNFTILQRTVLHWKL